jgi:hypothetical protein
MRSALVVGALLPEQNDECAIARSYMPLEALGRRARRQIGSGRLASEPRDPPTADCIDKRAW